MLSIGRCGEQVAEEIDIEIGGIPLHSGSHIGPYRYERPVGKGGMANVLLATDPNNRKFAIKVLKPSRFRTGKRRFLKECRILARMRHPNVIHLDSYGDIFGHPYIAMEYIEGTDLHKVIRSLRDRSLSQRWSTTRRVLTDLCKGLAYIHSHGIVHRDLKPSNILIDQSGRSVITDFGIVKLLNDDSDASTTLVGTWAYASPEQFSTRTLDQRSDLYSLGIILYAMLCSRRPFAANNMQGYLKLHRDQPPKPPSDFIPEIPTLLEDICLKLLEKSPQDRFQSANEILTLLGEVEPGSQQLDAENTLAQIPFLDSGVCDNLVGLFHEHNFGCFEILGEEGYGKSRLMQGLGLRFQQLGVHGHRVTFPVRENAYNVAIQLAEHIAKESGSQQLAQTLLLFSRPDITVDSNFKHKIFNECRIALQALLQERPQVFLIDDLPLCDEQSLEFLGYLYNNLAQRAELPFYVFYTAVTQQSFLPATSCIELEPMSQDHIKAVIERMAPNLETNSAEIIAHKLLVETEGLPLFLHSFLEQLIQEQMLVLDENGFRFNRSAQELHEATFELPPTIRQMLHRQLDGITENAISILQLLAVSGQPLSSDQLLDCLDIETNDFFDQLEPLIAHKLLREKRTGFDEQIELVRRKMGEVLYDELKPELRKELHKRLADSLSNEVFPTLALQQAIGQHYIAGGQPDKAYQILTTALLQSWNRGLVRPAKHLLSLIEPLNRKARASLSPKEFSEARYKLLKVKVAIAHNLGHWNDAIRLCKTKLRCAKQLNEWAKIMDTRISLGDLLTRINENAAGIAELNSILEETKIKNDVVRQARVIHHLCANAWQERNLETCVQLASQGLQLLGPNDNSLSCAQLLLSHSAAQATLGSLQPACADLERALTILTELNQRELQSIVHCNLSEVQMWRGEWIVAINHAKDALNLSQEMMYKSGELHANVSLAMLLLELGQHQKVSPILKHASALAQSLNSTETMLLCWGLSAVLNLDTGKLFLAEEQLNKAIANTEQDPEFYSNSLFAIKGYLMGLTHRWEDADRCHQQAMTDFTALPPARKIEVLFYSARMLLRQNKAQQAAGFLQKADKMAIENEMLGYGLRVRALQQHPSLCTPSAQQSFQELLKELQSQLSPSEQDTLTASLQRIIN